MPFIWVCATDTGYYDVQKEIGKQEMKNVLYGAIVIAPLCYL